MLGRPRLHLIYICGHDGAVGGCHLTAEHLALAVADDDLQLLAVGHLIEVGLKEELLLIQVGRDAHAPQSAHGNWLHPNGGPDTRDAGVETSIGVEPPTLLAAWLHP